jgi:protoporphyrinogen oxidase
VISLSHNKSPDRAPHGHSLFSIFTEHNEFERMSALSDDDAVLMVREQIESMYPEVKGHFLFSYISRQVRVSYVPDAGFFHRTKQLWEVIGKEPRVQLTGDIFMFGGLEAAVASGERAAERLLKKC